MKVGKLARKIEFAAMELRGYLTSIEKLSKEIRTWSDQCEKEAHRCGEDETARVKAAKWEEAYEVLAETTAELPLVIECLENAASGIENAPTPLAEISQIEEAQAIATHDARLARRSAFNR